MSINQRFRVLKIEATIELHGIINDTSNLKVLDEMVSDCNRFDCTHIEGASWNGLLRLDKYLSQLKGSTTLTRVPFHIFQYLRLLPKLSQRYIIEDIELKLLDFNMDKPSTLTRFFEAEFLTAISNQSRSPFIKLEDGTSIIGRDAFVCPSSFGSRKAVHGSILGSWYQNNTEQFDFWYDYTSFANITLDLALDLVQSQGSSIDTLLKDIELGIKAIEESLAILIPEFVLFDHQDLSAVRLKMNNSFTELVHILEKSSQEGSALLVQMQRLVEDQSFSQAEPFYHLLQKFCEKIGELRPALIQIENIGATTGKEIASLSRLSAYKNLILAINTAEPASIDAVRLAMDIMDPLSEGDWDGTRDEVIEYIKSVDQSLSKIIILLQGSDLLRQILEHRLNESATVEAALKVKIGDWRQTKTSIFSLVNRTLVTDQEKYSCEFFIPEAARKDENNQKPGDVLLF